MRHAGHPLTKSCSFSESVYITDSLNVKYDSYKSFVTFSEACKFVLYEDVLRPF